jgi:beta-glucanase (GH16 family)
MKKTIFILLVISINTIACKKDSLVEKEDEPIIIINPIIPKIMTVDYDKLLWTDEFEKDGKPDSKLWSYDIGGNGWGNQELQYYTDELENCKVEKGLLLITAKKQLIGNNRFTSTRLVSKGKGDFTYGRIEVKAQLPQGLGTWPAIWMLASQTSYGTQYWPDNGEIDIMEHVGFDQNVVHGNVHTKAFNHSIGTNKGNKLTVPDASNKMNIYAINWLPEKIEFEINGTKYFEFNKLAGYQWQEWPFDKPFYLILNIAVGGGWGGQKGVDETVFPQTLAVDYVRVYGLKEVK